MGWDNFFLVCACAMDEGMGSGLNLTADVLYNHSFMRATQAHCICLTNHSLVLVQCSKHI